MANNEPKGKMENQGLSDEEFEAAVLQKIEEFEGGMPLSVPENNEAEIDVQAEIKKKLEEIKGQVSPKDLKLFEEALNKRYVQHLPLYEAIGLNEDALEFMYLEAYNFYNAGKYDIALNKFHVLRELKPDDNRFVYGLAATYHMKKEYQKAIQVYMACRVLDKDNPVIYWHIAECYRHLGKKVPAILFLRFASQAASLNPMYEPIQIKAENLISVLDQEIHEAYQNKKGFRDSPEYEQYKKELMKKTEIKK